MLYTFQLRPQITAKRIRQKLTDMEYEINKLIDQTVLAFLHAGSSTMGSFSTFYLSSFFFLSFFFFLFPLPLPLFMGVYIFSGLFQRGVNV